MSWGGLFVLLCIAFAVGVTFGKDMGYRQLFDELRAAVVAHDAGKP